MPVLPWEIASAVMTAMAVYGFEAFGAYIIGLFALALGVYQLLLRALLEGQAHSEEIERRTAFINTVGEPDPDLFAGLDPRRAAESVIPEVRRTVWTAIDRRALPWTIVALPTPNWARQVFGEPDVARLWDAIRATVRLDEDDPVAAWRDHVAMLTARAAELNERGF